MSMVRLRPVMVEVQSARFGRFDEKACARGNRGRVLVDDNIVAAEFIDGGNGRKTASGVNSQVADIEVVSKWIAHKIEAFQLRLL